MPDAGPSRGFARAMAVIVASIAVTLASPKLTRMR
jgi:hypothetical protein